MIAVYVDDLNLIGTPHGITIEVSYLRKGFETKDLGKTRFCLGIQIEYLPARIFIHQSTYTKNMMKRFNMDNVCPLSTLMVVWTLDIQKNPFCPLGEEEIILGLETLYLSAIDALMYLVNNTRLDIAFAVNLQIRQLYIDAKTMEKS